MNIMDFFRGRIKRIGIVPVSIAVIIFSVAVIVAIVFVIKDAPQPLEVAVAVLTILIAIIAIYMGVTFWVSKKETKEELDKVKADWEAFEKRQEPIIKETKEDLKRLQAEQDEIRWITTLKSQVIQTDPYLRKPESQKVVKDIAGHYQTDQDNEAWEMYGVGRYFDREHEYDKAIEYYEEALKKYLSDEGLKLHIYQSLGLDYFLKGKQLVKAGKNARAIKEYKQAIKNYDSATKGNPQSVEAFDNKGNTYIELAKISSDNKKEQLVYIDKAIKCYDDAIGIRVERDRQWWATCHFDKARALALRADKDKREDLDKVAKELEETLNTFVAKPVGFDVPDPFQDFKNVKHDKEIKRLLERLREVILQARLKGD